MPNGNAEMIEDPPILTLRRNFPRPDPALVAALKDVPAGYIVDCMDGSGAMHFRIKPLDPPATSVVGVAVTSDNGPADNLGSFGALAIAGAGDIVVGATGGWTGCAVIGDLMLGMMRNKGILAFVTDGLIRDVPGLRAVGLPIFSAGVTPNSPVRNGPGSAGLPVQCGGVRVESGDVIVADIDGVVVVPQARLAAVVERLATVRKAEAALDQKVRDGLQLPAFVQTIIESSKTRWVD